jgi:hypothetical protein
MNRVAIAFSTKDRVELTKRSIEPLLQPSKFETHWIDGSKTAQGIDLPREYCGDYHMVHHGVRGGSGPAIVYALTTMLNVMDSSPLETALYTLPMSRGKYDYIGLVENDVLLDKDWFDDTMALFERGKQDGLKVGAVSARTYEDRVLIQRNGYAVMHNLGAGMVVFTREAAQIVLDTYRTQWTGENRQIFAQLIGRDIGGYWAFRGGEHWLCADWRWDAILASRGFATLGLTPSPVEMIGQDPPLEDQGLSLVKAPLTWHGDDFDRYCDNLARIRDGKWKLSYGDTFFRDSAGGQTFFAHQIAALGGRYEGDWRLKDSIAFGPFGWQIADSSEDRPDSTVRFPVLGPCEVLLSGGTEGGQMHVVDAQSGFDAKPVLPPAGQQGIVVPVFIPGGMAYRDIVVTSVTPGCVFYGVRCCMEQPVLTNFKFDYSVLPPV